MRKYIYLLTFLFTLGSCTKAPVELGGETIEEGLPASVNLTVSQGEMSRAGLSHTQEQAIHNIFVLVFDKSGHKVSQHYFDTNINANLHNLSTQSGSDMSIYVVANLTTQNSNLVDVRIFFSRIYNLAELNQAKIYDLATDLSINRALVMTGTVTHQPISASGANTINIKLHYVAAKVTLYVVTALTIPTDSYALSDWTVVNYPQSSYLFPQLTDSGVAGNVNDFKTSTTTITWVDTTINVNGSMKAAKYAFLYMYENRRGTNSNTTQIDKALNVPTSATAIAMRGYYKSGTTVTGITTTVYLGNNNYNDYNVDREKEYAYVATVKGINDINVDSRVQTNTNGYQVNLFNTTMDCHADRRPIQIKLWEGTANIALYQPDGVTPCPWLKISTINLNQAVNNQRVQYNPATDMKSQLTLTFNANPSMVSQMAYIYADENTTTTTRNAIVKVVSTLPQVNPQTVTINVAQLGYQTLGNTGLRPILQNGTINNVGDYVLVMENLEEAAMNLTPGAAAGTEGITNMQWGYNKTAIQTAALGTQTYFMRNGYENTLLSIYNNTTGGINSTLLPAFGRLSASSASVASVTIPEDDVNPIFNTNSARYCFEKNRDLDGDGKISNPNTLGNDEIFWYLPSTDETMLVNVAYKAFSTYAPNNTYAYYSTSTESRNNSPTTNIYFMTYINGTNGYYGKSTTTNVRCVRKLPNNSGTLTSPYVEPSSNIINNTGFKAAALRTGTQAYPVPIHSVYDAYAWSVSKRFLVASQDCRVDGNGTGSLSPNWMQANGWTSAASANNSPGILASPATGCQAYAEGSYPAGTWRVPTLREIQIISLINEQLSSPLNYTGQTYWASTTTGVHTYGWFLAVRDHYVASDLKVNYHNLRCVHDL